jgi:hypothetical protein
LRFEGYKVVELDPKSNEFKVTIFIALAIGGFVGFVTLVATLGDDFYDGLCWMTGCFSSFFTFIVVFFIFAKKGQESRTFYKPRGQYPKQSYKGVQYTQYKPPTREVTVHHRPPQGYERLPKRPKAQKVAPTRPVLSTAGVLNAMNDLPNGLPPSLWGLDWNKLAEDVVRGQKSTDPKGRQIVYLKDKWYYADPSDVGTFLQEC